MVLRRLTARSDKGQFVCQIVGDGAFMFSVPSTVFWIAQHYGIPVLTVVLNNKGMMKDTRDVRRRPEQVLIMEVPHRLECAAEVIASRSPTRRRLTSQQQ